MKLIIFLTLIVFNISKAQDSLFVAADSLEQKSVDTLFAIYNLPFSDFHSFYTHTQIEFSDYRNFNDIFRYIPASFNRDFGFIYHPSEINLYGVSNRHISYLIDGVEINNRYLNSYNTEYIQTENIDSIEIIPPSKSFLYSINNNLLAVNLISREFIPPAPYTRVKYYEGPFDEGFIDFQFNTMLYQKFNLYADIQNKKTERIYPNSGSSFWQAYIRMKYFASNQLNLSLSYFHSKSNFGLNGGVDIDTLKQLYTNYEEAIYDNILAKVVYPDRYQKNSQNHFTLRTQIRRDNSMSLDISLYYKDYLDEYRQNEFEQYKYEKIQTDSKAMVYGTQVRHRSVFKYFDLDILGGLEYISYDRSVGLLFNSSTIGISGVFRFKVSDSIFPEFFIKRSYIKDEYYSGIGGGVVYLANKNLKLNSNVSFSEYPRTGGYFNSKLPTVLNIDGGLSYKNENDFSKFSLDFILYTRFFKEEEGDYPYPRPAVVIDPFPVPFYKHIFYIKEKVVGASVDANLLIGFIESKLILNYYNEENNLRIENVLPNYSMMFSLSYVNTHFDSALFIKAGFNFRYADRIAESNYSFFNNYIQYVNRQLNPNFIVDFTAYGRIQEAAILYFSVENIFDRKYYFVPYYPMPGRGIRFGFSWELFN